jgi:hypothetical protein
MAISQNPGSIGTPKSVVNGYLFAQLIMVTIGFNLSPYDSSRIVVLRNHFLFLLAKMEACPRSSVNEGCR